MIYNRKNIITLLLIASVFFAVNSISTNSIYGQDNNQNLLQLKGKILHGYTADFQVFQYIPTSSEWNKIISKRNKIKYEVKLNPQLNYQIIFMSNQGKVKVLHIDSGDEGMWIKEVDVDFDLGNILHAKISRSTTKKEYDIITVPTDYINQE